MDELMIWLLLFGGGLPFLRRWLGRFGFAMGTDDSAFDTLRRRYAAGEITREQFEEMKQVLTQESSGRRERRKRWYL